MNEELENIKNYFTENRRICISATGVEKVAGVTPKTLIHFLKNRRGLSEEAIKKIIPVLIDLGYKPIQKP